MAKKLKLHSGSPEAQIQQAIIGWARDYAAYVPEIGLLYMVNNGTYGSDYRMWNWLNSMGLLPGLPDLALPVARGGFFSQYIEVKADPLEHMATCARILERRECGIKLSKSDEKAARQIDLMKALGKAGNRVDVVYQPKEGEDVLIAYLKQPRTVAIPFTSHDDEMCSLDGYCAKHNMTHAE